MTCEEYVQTQLEAMKAENKILKKVLKNAGISFNSWSYNREKAFSGIRVEYGNAEMSAKELAAVADILGLNDELESAKDDREQYVKKLAEEEANQ